MKTVGRPAWGAALWQVPLIVMIAVSIGLAINAMRPEGIPLGGDWSAQARLIGADGKPLAISLEDAEQLFTRKDALFLDARPQIQFAQGHIRGAVNLPWQAVDRYFMEMAERLENAETIVTYCDGESCDLSHELTLFLKDMGFENTRVLVNGWTVWQQAGLPTDVGG